VGRATLRDGAGKTTRAENRYRPELTIILDWGQNAPGPHPVRALYVCLCHGITDSEIRDAAAAGCDSMPELMMRTGCGSSCGSCIETATGLVAEALLPLPVVDKAA